MKSVFVVRGPSTLMAICDGGGDVTKYNFPVACVRLCLHVMSHEVTYFGWHLPENFKTSADL
jgi:hypothetical protein